MRNADIILQLLQIFNTIISLLLKIIFYVKNTTEPFYMPQSKIKRFTLRLATLS